MVLNYYKYYKEVKNRLMIIFFGWALCLSVCYSYKEALLFLLINSNQGNNYLSPYSYFIYTNVTEVFYTYIELTLFVTNQTLLFSILYHVLMFLTTGLYRFEFIKLKTSLQLFFFIWIIFNLSMFKYILPLSWNFFLSFQDNFTDIQSISFFFEAKLMEYFHYFTNLYYISLISCQFLTFIIIVLINLREKLEKTKVFRKLFYLIFVVFSTIITPPDVLSQICISIFLIAIYELLLLVKQVQISMVTN